MIKTTQKICKSCIYTMPIASGTQWFCNYMEITGKMRGCEVGYCDKYVAKKKKTKAKPKPITYSKKARAISNET